MNEKLQTIKHWIGECTHDERVALLSHLQKLLPHPLETEWGIESDLILGAIRRSSDLTKRGVRGIIAEAVFERYVIPEVKALGWKSVESSGDIPYDSLLQKGDLSARVQIKLQRLEKGKPKLFYPRHYGEASQYVVEVQKTRGGEKFVGKLRDEQGDRSLPQELVKTLTRPYRFGDFDILAVNMHPSTGDWNSFRFTLAAWLIPRQPDKSMIEIFQPVALTPNDVWTDKLGTCLQWLQSNIRRKVFSETAHVRIPRSDL